ncbi:MAG TPA: ferredoxin--NADP reductase [Flavobacterium sp.]|nr:ferredoxin--NADP reductase [Flavobacterium sp.]
MSTFHSLQVIDVRRETPKSVSVAFSVPDNLKSDYQFVAGQYINIKYIHENEEIRRSYSVCSSPNSDELRIVVKEIENGIFSRYANTQLKVGDVLEVGTPEGRFVFEPDATNERNILAIAAGSGITPVISIMQSVLENEPKSKAVLIYGNRNVEETIFYQQILALQEKYPNNFYPYFTFTRAQADGAHFGRIDKPLINFVTKNKHKDHVFDAFYVCGPEDLIHKASDILAENGVEKDRVKFELFTPMDNQVEVQTEGQAELTVTVDGVTTTFPIDKKADILSSALKHGVDAPYSCQGGICSSCMCRVIEGGVEMISNHILTDEEIEEGLILSCQSYAITDKIVIDYDDV